ncbi:Jag N-terminal domain-containing protein [Desulforhopalus vacuolatus]|uniref:Jag family protein n=1 Tax=Desulforhopalus vacuolatus TaxID=40414 RepID=UPI001964672F|nr:Jag N-terminal domain-containing protein [Desulforhopalus vacuolatus]MBM9519345.1 Jag N-terminal domain-containing protein [Desulforhopalus vacuolatus]
MPEMKEYSGKDVNGAIESACADFGVLQMQLKVEVLDTGSAGIFGIGRKDARIRVGMKAALGEIADDPFGMADIFDEGLLKPEKSGAEKSTTAVPAFSSPSPAAPVSQGTEAQASEEIVESICSELVKIVQLMGFPSTTEVQVEGLTVNVELHGDFEEELIGEEGRVVDSLQYLIRKIASRKSRERLRINLDVGNYRCRRIKELCVKAVTLAAAVKDGGSSRIMPGLSPTERREVHLALRHDSGVRSRSVGEGMFKKVLIYKPGSSNGGRKSRRSSRRREE